MATPGPVELLILVVLFLLFVGGLVVVSAFLLVYYVRGRRRKDAERFPNLVDCPDCGRQVSRQAERCPRCGRPNPAQGA